MGKIWDRLTGPKGDDDDGESDGEKSAEPRAPSRRQFLRGNFADRKPEPNEDGDEQKQFEPKPFDLVALLARADPAAANREFTPGVGRGAAGGRRGNVPVLRPPGAVEESAFLERCTRGGDCIDACPYGSIRLAPARFQNAAGTPMIDPFQTPCHACVDVPCIAACPTGALHPAADHKIGIAHLQVYNCLAHTGSFCTVCSERCPVEGAIALDDHKPQIVDTRCTGCGVCHSVCPAPVNAIMIMPVPTRRLPSDQP